MTIDPDFNTITLGKKVNGLKRGVKPDRTWSPQTALANERYVDITFSTNDGNITWVTNTFPLSLLLQYSARAQKELPKLGGEGQRILVWTLPEPVDGSGDPRDLIQVLKWIRFSLSARGFPATYEGHPQMPGPEPWDCGQLTRTLLAAPPTNASSPKPSTRPSITSTPATPTSPPKN